MSLHANKALLAELFAAINANNFDPLAPHPGFWETRQVVPPMHRIFSHWQTLHLQQIAESNQVFTYGLIQMTHSGPFAGIPPTNRLVTLEVFSLDQVDDGLVTEHNSTATWPDLFRQLGVPGFAAWTVRTPRPLNLSGRTSSASTPANKAIVLQLPQMLSQGRVSDAGLRHGLAELRAEFEQIHPAFPNLEYALVCQLAEGDLVATRVKMHGTHQGQLFGFAPTGKTITWDQYLFNRIADGAVVEHAGSLDWTAALLQMGLFPSL